MTWRRAWRAQDTVWWVAALHVPAGMPALLALLPWPYHALVQGCMAGGALALLS